MKIPSFLPLAPNEPLKSGPPRVEHKGMRPPETAEGRDQARLKQACQDFESIFLNHLLSKMRESIPKSELMGNSQGEDMYRGMLDEELAKQMAASGGMGLGQVLYRQMTEGKSPPKG